MGLGNHLLRIDDTGRDHHAAGEKLLRQFADFSALVEDGLLGFVGSGNLIFGVVSEPDELRALPPHQEGGFRNINWPVHFAIGAGGASQT